MIFAGDAEQACSAARNATFAASNAVPSKPVYGFAPLHVLVPERGNALPAGPPAALAAVPRSPTTGLPIPSSVGPSLQRLGHERLRRVPLARPHERRGELQERLGEVDDHPAGRVARDELPRLGVERRLVGVPRDVDADLAAELLPLRDEELLERRAEGVVARADVDGRALAELLERRLREHLALQRVGRVRPPDVAVVGLIVVICGALAVGEIRTTWFGIVTDCAIGIVAPEAISPMITLTCSPTSFFAASTEARRLRLPVLRVDELDLDLLREPGLLSAAFWSSIASLTALSMLPPYAARSPVNGRTSPIRSVNEQFALLACACVGLAVETAAPTETATAAIAIAATARVTLIDLSTGRLLSILPPLRTVGNLTDLPLRRKGLVAEGEPARVETLSSRTPCSSTAARTLEWQSDSSSIVRSAP